MNFNILTGKNPLPVRDGHTLIATAQKAEHCVMANYGCLHEWAKLLENKKAAAFLLGEES